MELIWKGTAAQASRSTDGDTEIRPSDSVHLILCRKGIVKARLHIRLLLCPEKRHKDTKRHTIPVRGTVYLLVYTIRKSVNESGALQHPRSGFLPDSFIIHILHRNVKSVKQKGAKRLFRAFSCRIGRENRYKRACP